MQFRETFSNIENIENRQLYRLNAEPAIELRSTFCMFERHIAGLNSVKLLAELTTKNIQTDESL